MKMVINSDATKSKAIGLINSEYREHKYLRLSIVTGKARTVAFNALSWAWYQQISVERNEYSPDDIHAECKLRFGVPILRRDDESFREQYDAHIKPLDYEPKKHFVNMIPVTSCMTNNQMKEYMERIQMHYASLETDPVFLEFPDERD